MPIYEYQCRRCDKRFQSLVMKKEEEKGLSCPECRSRDLKRLISRVAYHVSEGDRLAKQLGADLGSGFEEKLEKLRTDPGSVIKDTE